MTGSINNFLTLSDEQLVEIFLQARDRWTKRKIINEFFKRYFLEFDKTIRFGLKYESIPYESNTEYYDKVFSKFYERIFDIKLLGYLLDSPCVNSLSFMGL